MLRRPPASCQIHVRIEAPSLYPAAMLISAPGHYPRTTPRYDTTSEQPHPHAESRCDLEPPSCSPPEPFPAADTSKETLNARSEYSNSEDDGTAQHRINQYLIKQEIGRGSFGAVHLAVDQYGQEFVRIQPTTPSANIRSFA